MTRMTISMLAFMLGSSAAFAQAATPAPVNAPLMPNPPAAAPATPSAVTAAPSTDKQARSKQCSMEADQKGLHGKARKTYRSKCKAGKA